MPSSYKNSQNKEQPMFELTFNQGKQVRESKFLRKAVIHYIEELESKRILVTTINRVVGELGVRHDNLLSVDKFQSPKLSGDFHIFKNIFFE